MTKSTDAFSRVLVHSPVRVVFGAGRLDELGTLAKAEGAAHALLVTDPGVRAAGHVDLAVTSLQSAGIRGTVFDQVSENPTDIDVCQGENIARAEMIDFLIALGGGSAIDCAKGINLVLTNGGRIQDYWGANMARRPLLPWIAIPTTAGTGSEAQSYALISDSVTHCKMACGDTRLPSEGGLRPRVTILDPELTRTMPRHVAASTGIDAIAHAVESAASTARTAVSRELSRAAWKLLSDAYPTSMQTPDEDSRADMLWGAHIAGLAIEHSMLGAAHACANPITAHFGVAHGLAVGLMLPHVVRFNTAAGANPYADLTDRPQDLLPVLDTLLEAGHTPRRLIDHGITADHLPLLAQEASEQWTAGFNPRPVGHEELLQIYRSAFE